jgi:hypothetical protein
MTGPVAEQSSDTTFRLMYRSRSRIPDHDRKAQLGAIFSVARSSNKKAGVTGALLVSGDWFVQILEGDETVVRALFDRIFSDPRHERVDLLETTDVAPRTFGRWAMAKVAADGEPDIPLITNIDRGGIVPAAPRPTTPDQDALLDRMREALPERATA